MSPSLAAVIQKENSPVSETITGLEASNDFAKAISFFKNSLSVQGHSPKGKKGSFSTCQAQIFSESRYRKTISLRRLRTFSCCSDFFKPWAQSGMQEKVLNLLKEIV